MPFCLAKLCLGFISVIPAAIGQHSPYDEISLVQIGRKLVKKSDVSTIPAGAWFSTPASEFGLNEKNALLDGGGPELSLFADGKVPEEDPPGKEPESWKVSDGEDACAPGDVSGYTVSDVTKPTLVPFVVDSTVQGRKKSAAVIIAPGGGSRYLAWNKEGTRVAKWLNSVGISAFVLKYRVPSDTPISSKRPIQDAQRAISLVRSMKQYNFTKVGFMGFSAGGRVAAAVGTAAKLYSYTDKAETERWLPDFVLSLYGPPPVLAYVQAAAPPPTFLAIAKDDQCVPASTTEDYYKMLSSVGFTKHELHVYATGGHGWGDCSLYVPGGKWLPLCTWTMNAQAFIEKQLGIHHPLGIMKYEYVPE